MTNQEAIRDEIEVLSSLLPPEEFVTISDSQVVMHILIDVPNDA
jgi:hypothetical protein